MRARSTTERERPPPVLAFASLFGHQYEGGANWLEATLLGLGALAQPPTCLVVGCDEDALPPTLRGAEHLRALPLPRMDEVRPPALSEKLAYRLRLRRPRAEDSRLSLLAARHDVDLWVAFAHFPGLGAGRPLLICYPDFQFRHLPEFFDAREAAEREEQWGQIVARADGVMTISEATARDALRSHPEVGPKLRVCGFPAIFQPEVLRLVPDEVRRKYQLPERFFLVSNQFWQHKNHALVLRALELLKRRDQPAPVVVMTGRPHDPRRPEFFSGLLRSVQEMGLHEHCRFLGVLPRDEQVALIRAAEAVIQPSRFEGRGAITEETCLLGTQLLCSDIPTHRELDLPGAVFFGADDAETLAGLLLRRHPKEARGAAVVVAESHRRARNYGERLLVVCEEVMARRRDASPNGAGGAAPTRPARLSHDA